MLFCALLFLGSGGFAAADPCRLEAPEESQRALGMLRSETLVVAYCWWCDAPEPVPIRVRSVSLEHMAPTHVRAIAWARPEPEEVEFPVDSLRRAEVEGTGPLAEFLRRDIEAGHSDTTGFLGPDDPYLVREKQQQYAMQLRFVREDYEARTWDELRVNGEPADPRLLYVAAGVDVYRSVGRAVGCSMQAAPTTVKFRPVERDPSRENPPIPFVADITGKCYDGACPRQVWRATRTASVYAAPREEAGVIGSLLPGEQVTPLRTESHVVGGRAVALEDHGRIFAGDVFYLLDSQAEGFHRFWHYGDVFVMDATGIDIGPGGSACRRDERSCWARAEEGAQEIWWAEVRRADDSAVWVRDPLRTLDGVLRSD